MTIIAASLISGDPKWPIVRRGAVVYIQPIIVFEQDNSHLGKAVLQ